MPNPLRMFQVPSFRGGVNDFAAVFGGMAEDESLSLKNLVLDGAGRMTMRRGIKVTDTLLGDDANAVDNVLWVGPFGTGMIAVGWQVKTPASNSTAWVYTSSSQDGTGFSRHTAELLYQGSVIPKIIAQEIEAPDANRMYFADEDGTYNLKYYEDNTPSIVEPTEDFDDDDTAEVIAPTFVAEFNYHLFLAGFDSADDPTAPEAVRWSTPGLTSLADPDFDGDGHSTHSAVEFFINDIEQVGRPGEPIKVMAKAGGGLVIIKESNVHYWWGFDRDTWGQRHISGQFGAVNREHAFANGWLYYMSPQGPARTNGQTVQFIGQNIRQFLQGVDNEENTIIFHNPTQFQVVYMFPHAGDTYASRGKAWSYLHDAWTEPEFFDTTAGTRFFFLTAREMGTATLPAAEAGPTGLAVSTSLSNTCVNQNTVSWTNGDTAPATETIIYRLQQVTAPTSVDWDGAPELDRVDSGVDSYVDSVAQNWDTQYWYQVRHTRNEQLSNWANDAANGDTDDVTVTTQSQPTDFTAPTLDSSSDQSQCDGAASMCPTTNDDGVVSWRVKLDWTNNHGGEDDEEVAVVEIQGKDTAAGSFEKITTISTYDLVNETTLATQSVTLTIDEHPTLANRPEYNYFRIRVTKLKGGLGHDDCDVTSPWSATEGPVISQNPCTCDAIPV